MEVLAFTVINKEIECDIKQVVGDNDYQASFMLDDEWSDKEVICRVVWNNRTSLDIKLEDLSCVIPAYIMKRGEVSIGVYAEGDEQLTTEPWLLSVRKSIREKEFETAMPHKEIWNEINEKIKNVITSNDLDEKVVSSVNDTIEKSGFVKNDELSTEVSTQVNAYLDEELEKEESRIASKDYIISNTVTASTSGWNLIETDYENKLSVGANWSGDLLRFKQPILLEKGSYVFKAKIKCSSAFRLNNVAQLYISAGNSKNLSASKMIIPGANNTDYQEMYCYFDVQEETTYTAIWFQFKVSDESSNEKTAYFKEVQIVRFGDENLPYVKNNIIGYMNDIKDSIRTTKNELILEPYEEWMPIGYFSSLEQENYKGVAMPDGQICFNEPIGSVTRYKINSEKYYLLKCSKHVSGYPICIEYDLDDITKPTNVIVSDETNICGIVKFKDTTKYVSLCFYGAGSPPQLYRIPFANGLWTEDMYPYEEVLKEGYLPNPDSGVMDWDWNSPTSGCEYVNNIFDDFTFGQLYQRYSWAAIWNEETKQYDFSKIKSSLEKAITYKTRMQIGAFSSLYPAHKDYEKEYDDKVIWYNFPSYIYDIAYEAESYPLKFIKYANITVNGKPVYNAVIDWRNDEVRTEYRLALQKFSEFLKTESTIGVPYKKVVSSIQIRFFGKYGEGHNGELYTDFPDNHEDSETLKSIVDMYLEFFDDIQLIAPVDGKSTNSISLGLSDWQKYYLTAENSVGKFGFFNDHIGASLTFKDIVRNYDDIDLMEEFGNRYMVAPVTGENINSGEYGSDLLTLQFLLNDVQHYRYNTYRWNNVTGIGKTPSYRHPSVKKMIQKSFDMCGYRLFFVPIAAYIESNKVNAKFRIGNMGLTPCYSNYWNAQLVIRDSNGNELQVIDNIFDCKTVSMMKEPMTPCWKYMDVVSINEPCLSSVDYTGAKFYLRVIDTDGISNNMYLSNIDRTENGEYLLF